MQTPGSSHSPWHFRTWSEYFARMIRPTERSEFRRTPVRMTRRQELLAAQDKKRKEQRAHVLELLREVKEKSGQNPPAKDPGFVSHHG
jgi:beta-phosphoglucomutase-like phosphatase (HAD superfamily)